VTNQPEVARGKQTRQAVEEINQRLRSELPLDDVLTCYHEDKNDCDCRKPKPGLILRAAQQYRVDLQKSYMIGDRWRDIDAGANAGCKTILIDFGYRERTPASIPDFRAQSLSEAVDWILKNSLGASVRSISELQIKLFADGADKAQILQGQTSSLIKGFTTNPTLMRAAGVKDYETFAHEILEVVTDKPISLEVFADEFAEMERQAHKIASWAENVYVKIPVTNTRREPSKELIRRLAHSGVKVNVTAILTLQQVCDVVTALAGGAPSVVSVFAGRIADTGLDPVPMMAEAVKVVSLHQDIELLWASPRELLNIFQANDIGCHIITATDGVLSKLKIVGKDLDDYSLETVKMFHNDAAHSGYVL
jgi:transaldolase